MSNRLFQCELTSGHIFNGKVHLIVNTPKGEKKVSLYMKLLEACPRHDAILYKDEECTYRYGQFNYARCLVDIVNEGTRFRMHERDGNSGLLFEAPSPSDAANWIRAFQGRTKCPYSSLVRRRYTEHEHCATAKNIDLHGFLTPMVEPY